MSDLWFHVKDASGTTEYVRAESHGDAADLLYQMRKRRGMYSDVPEYNVMVMLIGGPANPRMDVFEVRNQGNVMAMDTYYVISEEDAHQQSRDQYEAERRAERDRSPEWLRTGRHG